MDESKKDVMMEIPVMKGVMRGWIGREDDNCLYFRMDVPGLGEEHIKVSMEMKTNILLIEGVIEEDKMGTTEAKLGDKIGYVRKWEGVRKYKTAIEIPTDFFNTDEIKTEIKNGVLKVVVPKVEVADGVGKGEKLINFKVPNVAENPFLEGVRRNWYAKVGETGSLLVRIDIPGLGEDDLDVRREVGIDDETGDVFDSLVVEGTGEEESDLEGGGRRRFRCRVDNSDFFQTSRIMSIKNGVCLLCIPPSVSRLRKDYPNAFL